MCNSGVIAIGSHHLWPMLHKLSPANAQGELYLTDVVELMHEAGQACAISLCPEADTAGVSRIPAPPAAEGHAEWCDAG